MKTVFLINPIAGLGKVERIQRVIKRQLASHPEMEYTLYVTKSASDTQLAARQFIHSGYDLLVAVGGDGTVNQVGRVVAQTADGACDRHVVMGILPTGSGNGLARHLGISMDLSHAVQQIASGHDVAIDVGTLNGDLFFCTSGLGFDAHIGHVFSESKSRGKLRYAQLIMTEFPRYEEFMVNMKIDAISYQQKAFLVTFANASQWGNNFYIAPKASITDNLVHTVICSKPHPLEMPLLAGECYSKTLDWNHHIQVVPGKAITVFLEKPTWFHYDGEPILLEGITRISVLSQALRVRVPKRKKIL